VPIQSYPILSVYLFFFNMLIKKIKALKIKLNFDKIWWKHGFHHISSNFIKVHQKNQGFEKKLNFDEIWWNLVKTWCFIKFHQSSSKKSRFWKKNELWWNLMKFDENMVFHQISSNFIKFHQKNQGFEKKNELWWNLMKKIHQISSNFIKVHQSSSKFIKTKFVWKKCNNQWLKPDLDLQHLEKVEINVTNDCWTLVLVLNSYVLYVCLVSNTNLFWLGIYWKTRVLLK